PYARGTDHERLDWHRNVNGVSQASAGRVARPLLQSLEACASLLSGGRPRRGTSPMQGHLSNSVETIGFNGMVLDVAGHSLVDAHWREVSLTRGEFAILVALARRPGQVLSR